MGYRHSHKRKERLAMGSNLTRDGRRTRRHSRVWATRERDPIRSTQTKHATNLSLLRTPMATALPIRTGERSQDRMHRAETRSELRVKEDYRVRRTQRQKWAAMYSNRLNVTAHVEAQWKRRQSKPAMSLETMESLLTRLELRADVVLWRSGLTASLNMARQRIRHGHVTRTPGKRPDERLVLRHPGMQRTTNDVRNIHAAQYERRRPSRALHWSTVQRGIPANRRPDWEKGAVLVLRRPRSGDVVLPARASASVVSLFRR